MMFPASYDALRLVYSNHMLGFGASETASFSPVFVPAGNYLDGRS